MLRASDGRVMRNTSHPVDFAGWKAQLDDLSLRETGNRNKYYNDIRDELYREMDQAESSFVYSSWIPGTIWPEPYDKIYDCLGTGDDPGQWNVARWFYGLLLQDVMIHRTDQEWEAFVRRRTEGDSIEIPRGRYTGAPRERCTRPASS